MLTYILVEASIHDVFMLTHMVVEASIHVELPASLGVAAGVDVRAAACGPLLVHGAELRGLAAACAADPGPA